MDDAELVRRLREPTLERGLDEKWIDAQRNCAADRIEALKARVARDMAISDDRVESLVKQLVLTGASLAKATSYAEKAEAERDAARDAALEEAAKVAESPDLPVFKRGWSTSQDAAAISTMMTIAAAIRSLKGKSHE